MKKNDFIFSRFSEKLGQIAILIDPEKTQDHQRMVDLIKKADFAGVDYFFVGGSTVTPEQMERTIAVIKGHSETPVVIFPGDHQQVSERADGLLYLSLLSGRNPEYLIGQHVTSAKRVYNLQSLEIIPTAYILVDGGTSSSVAYVSQTTPIPRDKTTIAVNTALAGILQGKRLVYFDAGSGAKQSVPCEMLKELRKNDKRTPIIVGGGIRSVEQLAEFKNAGVNVTVVGNHIEENIDFLLEVNAYTKKTDQ
tara:strand:- start:59783 stop:60535 length:753 start_codon:yes stop_codon:yes gene_type:complete